ncbi:MAG: hypothetical protein P4L59_06340 [Desulfosporosinus sp.]|nr:hypothetical protein [Desulfosporosinus sp.]
MFDFIPYIVIPFIMLFSKSYQEDVILSILVFIPFFSIRILYIYNKNRKMGAQLIGLRKNPSEERSVRKIIIVAMVFVIFILAFTYYLSNNFRIGVPWLILTMGKGTNIFTDKDGVVHSVDTDVEGIC